MDKLKNGPVVVYNDDYEEQGVVAWSKNPVVVQEDTDIDLLRAIHLQKEGAYRLFIIS